MKHEVIVSEMSPIFFSEEYRTHLFNCVIDIITYKKRTLVPQRAGELMCRKTVDQAVFGSGACHDDMSPEILDQFSEHELISGLIELRPMVIAIGKWGEREYMRRLSAAINRYFNYKMTNTKEYKRKQLLTILATKAYNIAWSGTPSCGMEHK